MRLRHAMELIAGSGVEALGPTSWADLGCGDGTFTVALAHLLAPGSTIHAVDIDRAALRRIPGVHEGVGIVTHHADFLAPDWPFDRVDGLLMANALHYVRDQPAFLQRCASYMTPPRRLVVVEYDSDAANPWVPYPVSRARLARLFEDLDGAASIVPLGSRPSIYQRAPIYAALVRW